MWRGWKSSILGDSQSLAGPVPVNLTRPHLRKRLLHVSLKPAHNSNVLHQTISAPRGFMWQRSQTCSPNSCSCNSQSSGRAAHPGSDHSSTARGCFPLLRAGRAPPVCRERSWALGRTGSAASLAPSLFPLPPSKFLNRSSNTDSLQDVCHPLRISACLRTQSGQKFPCFLAKLHKQDTIIL